MFIGEYRHNVDEKGRMAVPSKFRTELKKGAVVTRGLDNCLFLYTKSEWEIFVKEKFSKLSLGQADARAVSRHLLGGAMDVSLDGQGRIIVPEYLRKSASIKKNVVIVGLYNRFEIWDEGNWEIYKQNTEKASTQIAEKMGEVGF